MITGAGGFLGGHLCRHFGGKGFQVAAVGRFRAALNVADSYPNLHILGGMTLPDPALAEIVAGFQPDLLVHCAGTSSVADSVREPYRDFQKTVDVCAFTLETLRRHAPGCFFVQLSSASVYGNPAKLPIDETAMVNPISPYGFHKVVCEDLVREYGTLHGLSTAVFRIFSAYGEGLRRQVVHDLCEKILTSPGESVDVIGTGAETRDFIHATDIAAAVECAFTHRATGVFNLGSGDETTIADLFRMLAKELRVEQRPRYLGEGRSGDPRNWCADIQALTRLGFKPTVSLRAGIKSYCRWFTTRRGHGSASDAWTAVVPKLRPEISPA